MAKTEILLLLLISTLIRANPTGLSYFSLMDFAVGAAGDVIEKTEYSIGNEIDSEIEKLPADEGWECANSTDNVVKCVLKSKTPGVSGKFVAFHSNPGNATIPKLPTKSIPSVFPAANVTGPLNDVIGQMSKFMESTFKIFTNAFKFQL